MMKPYYRMRWWYLSFNSPCLRATVVHLPADSFCIWTVVKVFTVVTFFNYVGRGSVVLKLRPHYNSFVPRAYYSSIRSGIDSGRGMTTSSDRSTNRSTSPAYATSVNSADTGHTGNTAATGASDRTWTTAATDGSGQTRTTIATGGTDHTWTTAATTGSDSNGQQSNATEVEGSNQGNNHASPAAALAASVRARWEQEKRFAWSSRVSSW